MLVQEGRAELEGVTFVGRTDVAATRDAPAISMVLCHEALQAHTKARVQMRGKMRLAIAAVGSCKACLR
jgi:hypothetical protein